MCTENSVAGAELRICQWEAYKQTGNISAWSLMYGNSILFGRLLDCMVSTAKASEMCCRHIEHNVQQLWFKATSHHTSLQPNYCMTFILLQHAEATHVQPALSVSSILQSCCIVWWVLSNHRYMGHCHMHFCAQRYQQLTLHARCRRQKYLQGLEQQVQRKCLEPFHAQYQQQSML